MSKYDWNNYTDNGLPDNFDMSAWLRNGSNKSNQSDKWNFKVVKQIISEFFDVTELPDYARDYNDLSFGSTYLHALKFDKFIAVPGAIVKAEDADYYKNIKSKMADANSQMDAVVIDINGAGKLVVHCIMPKVEGTFKDALISIKHSLELAENDTSITINAEMKDCYDAESLKDALTACAKVITCVDNVSAAYDKAVPDAEALFVEQVRLEQIRSEIKKQWDEADKRVKEQQALLSDYALRAAGKIVKKLEIMNEAEKL